MGSKRKPKSLIRKAVNEANDLTGFRRGATLKEEVWRDESGEVVRYSLAYINPRLCGLDNGRVLGYDNSHGHHHRHFMGTQEAIDYKRYEALAEQFYREVWALWRTEDEERLKKR